MDNSKDDEEDDIFLVEEAPPVAQEVVQVSYSLQKSILAIGVLDIECVLLYILSKYLSPQSGRFIRAF